MAARAPTRSGAIGRVRAVVVRVIRDRAQREDRQDRAEAFAIVADEVEAGHMCPYSALAVTR